METSYRLISIILFSACFWCSCQNGKTTTKVVKDAAVVYQNDAETREKLKKKYLDEGAWKHNMFSKPYRDKLDQGIAEDSTIAYFWQQKAMPLFKQNKYEYAMPFLDKAVKYNRAEYQEYRAFMKCIFAKDYRDAIADFEDCKVRFGNQIVMDHSYNFYIALSKIQLHQFAEAEDILAKDIAYFEEKMGKGFTHNLDWFYLGIAQFEQEKFEEALVSFDHCLANYAEFAEAHYYRAISLKRLGDTEAATAAFDLAIKNGKAGYTVQEDNAIYERYPYQMINW